MPTNHSITLYFNDARSDKIYTAGIYPRDAGFVVNFAFGRRGSTLQSGSKTPMPVDYQKAMKIYEKLVNEKLAKGYTPGQDGTPYQGTERESVSTGVFPQLLNSIDQEQAEELIRDDDWWMQEKFDGRRILIQKWGGQIMGINRKGLSVALPQPIAQQAMKIGGTQWLMDGEAIGGVYFAFDLLEHDNADLRQQPYSRRLAALVALVALGGREAIRVRGTATTTANKQEMLSALRRLKAEGVVFKRHAAPYKPGRPASGGDQLKLKFTATASCIVAKVNGTKRSVALELLDGSKRVVIGSVAIPANMKIPKAGSVIEARYLYAYFGGSLYQPVCLGVRDDIGVEACTVGQLKYKGSSEDEEDAGEAGGERP